jgi:hypothetical protein
MWWTPGVCEWAQREAAVLGAHPQSGTQHTSLLLQLRRVEPSGWAGCQLPLLLPSHDPLWRPRSFHLTSRDGGSTAQPGQATASQPPPHPPTFSVFPNQLQVHMALQLCPILGDHTYAARVGTVLGQRFLWPAETTKPQRQVGPLSHMPALCGFGGNCVSQISCTFRLGGSWLGV